MGSGPQYWRGVHPAAIREKRKQRMVHGNSQCNLPEYGLYGNLQSGLCPDLVGRHIYKMDYEVMLDYHKENHADVTIAAMPVPMEEASRFGIVVADGDGRITEFQEKPPEPKSNLASMGIYIFSWPILKRR